MSSRQHLLVVAACIGLLTCAAYLPILGNGFINFDDQKYITENTYVGSGITRNGLVWALTATAVSNWHPLTWWSHMLDVQIFGLHPAGHHATSLLLHIATAILLLLLLRRMTGHLWRSAAVAALFALHPLHVESVAWVAERKDVLAGLFWVLTTTAYLRYVQRPGIRRYALVLLGMVLGLLSKPMIVTLPFVLLLMDWWPLGRLRPHGTHSAGRLIAEKVPLLILSAVSSVTTFLVQSHGGSVQDMVRYPLSERLSNTLVSYVAYLGKMLWPLDLAFFYPYPGAALGSVRTFAALLTLLAVTFLAWRFQRHPALAFGWLWYLGTLVPVIGLVQVGNQGMADRYTYLPLIGIFIAGAWSLPPLSTARSAKVISAAAAVLLGLVLASLTFRQAQFWRNDLTLFGRAVAVTSGNWMAEEGFGTALSEVDLQRAEAHLREAVRLAPNYVRARYNLGLALARQAKYGEASAEFWRAVKLAPDNVEARVNLGNTQMMLGRYEDAAIQYREALRISPGQEQAAKNLRKLPQHYRGEGS